MSPENEITNRDQQNATEPWLAAAVDELRQPVAPSVAGQLRAARRTALAGAVDSVAPSWSFKPYLLAGLGVTAVLMASYLVYAPETLDAPGKAVLAKQSTESADQSAVLLEDMLIIAAPEGLEFYGQLEFLEWLEREEG